FTLDNERAAHDLHIRSVALPRHGPLTPKQEQVRHAASFRRAYRWRAGIEGRISVLKRHFGLARCRYRGEHGIERWVGWGILAHNLRQISRSVADGSAHSPPDHQASFPVTPPGLHSTHPKTGSSPG